MVPVRGGRAGGPLGAASGPPPGPALVKSPSGPGEPHTGHGPAWCFELIDPVGEGASAARKKFVLPMLDVSNRKKKKKIKVGKCLFRVLGISPDLLCLLRARSLGM